MANYCAKCGTEVDDTAVFCPTCGQPIDQAADVEMPAAPAWPEDAPPGPDEQPTRIEERPDPVARPAPQPDVERRQAPRIPPPPERQPDEGSKSGASQINVPVTWPVTMSAWLMGGGAALAALGVLISLFDGFQNPIDLLLMLLLIGVTVAIFFSASVPAMPHLRLATMAVAFVGFGVALDRIGFGAAGIGELLLFLGTAAAAIGAVLVEIGQDQPLGGPRK